MADNNRNRDDQYNQQRDRNNDDFFGANYYGSAGPYNTSYNSQYSQEDQQNQGRSYAGNRSNELRTGSHRGKGPKGYHRSEERIREDACERLTYDDRVDASNIEIQVQGDDLILSGTVNSKEEKYRAEDILENISGIRNVENRIRVGRSDEVYSRGSGNESGSATGISIPASTSGVSGQNITTGTGSADTGDPTDATHATGRETTSSRRSRSK